MHSFYSSISIFLWAFSFSPAIFVLTYSRLAYDSIHVVPLTVFKVRSTTQCFNCNSILHFWIDLSNECKLWPEHEVKIYISWERLILVFELHKLCDIHILRSLNSYCLKSHCLVLHMELHVFLMKRNAAMAIPLFIIYFLIYFPFKLQVNDLYK